MSKSQSNTPSIASIRTTKGLTGLQEGFEIPAEGEEAAADELETF